MRRLLLETGIRPHCRGLPNAMAWRVGRCTSALANRQYRGLMDAPVRIVNAPRKAAATDATEHPVTIHDFEGGWHGVTYKATQVSVSPDGSITLPKHLRPEDVEEFVAALRAAAPVASEVRAKAAAIVNARGVPADPRRVLSERWQQAMPTAPTPALSARPARPAFTAERLAAARAKLGGES